MIHVYCVTPPKGQSSMPTACIDVVAQRHFRTNSTVAVFSTDTNDYKNPSLFSQTLTAAERNLANRLSSSKKFSLVIQRFDRNSAYCSRGLSVQKPVNYFIFVGNSDDIVNFTKTFCFERVTNELSHFVIYIKLENMETKYTVENIIRTFWRHHHQNIVVLVETQQTVKAYTWFPLYESSEVRIVDECDGLAFR